MEARAGTGYREPMVTSPIPRPTAIPVACSLGAGEYRRRVEAWRALLRHAERSENARISTDPDPDPHAVTLRLPAGRAAELAALVVAEHECCPFFTFRITLAGQVVELHATAPESAAPLLAELFAGAPWC
jgi:MerR family transcriptional regulator, copper efflux regulator